MNLRAAVFFVRKAVTIQQIRNRAVSTEFLADEDAFVVGAREPSLSLKLAIIELYFDWYLSNSVLINLRVYNRSDRNESVDKFAVYLPTQMRPRFAMYYELRRVECSARRQHEKFSFKPVLLKCCSM